MNQKMKIALIILAALYAVSPIDVMPGPVDDLIVLLLSIAAQRRTRITGPEV